MAQSLDDLMKSRGFSAGDIQQVRAGKLVNDTVTTCNGKGARRQVCLPIAGPCEQDDGGIHW